MARTLLTLAPSVLAALLALVPAPPATGAGTVVEEVVDVPREHRIPLTISFEKSALYFLESQNDPRPEDIEEAKAKDPDDKTWVLLRFYYRNEGYTKQKVHLQALLLDSEGGVLARTDFTKKLARQKTEDTVTLPIKVRTLDWGIAAKMKVIATFLD